MRNLSPYRVLASLRHPSLCSLFSIDTHLTDRERLTLFRLSRKCATGAARRVNVVEIGSYLGASAVFLAAGLTKDRGEVFCIDTWENNAMSEGRRDTFAEFLANTKTHRERIVPLRGWSTEVRVIGEISRRASPIHLLFIDGDHSYEGALADWKSYSPYLAPGAFVVMHDIGWAEGVQRVVREEIRPAIHRERTLPNLWWGQIAP